MKPPSNNLECSPLCNIRCYRITKIATLTKTPRCQHLDLHSVLSPNNTHTFRMRQHFRKNTNTVLETQIIDSDATVMMVRYQGFSSNQSQNRKVQFYVTSFISSLSFLRLEAACASFLLIWHNRKHVRTTTCQRYFFETAYA